MLYPENLKCSQCLQLSPFEKGQYIYKQGEHARVFYYVQSGLVGLYHTLENGKESLVRLYQAGDFFGYRTLFGDNIYHCSAKPLLTTRLTCICPFDSKEFLLKNPNISQFLLNNIATELKDAEERLARMSYLRTLDRIIDSLYFLTETVPNYHWTHREIAEYAGCETETAIRIIRELRKKGLYPLITHSDE